MSSPQQADTVRVARQLADELLFPAAPATDASDAVPVELLDALAEAGLYGIVAPPDFGGVSADFSTVCAVLEALASGCLTTAFLWMQHIGLVRALTPLRRPGPASPLAQAACQRRAKGRARARRGIAETEPSCRR